MSTLKEQYDEFLDDQEMSDVITAPVSRVLAEYDPTAYLCGMADFQPTCNLCGNEFWPDLDYNDQVICPSCKAEAEEAEKEEAEEEEDEEEKS